LITLSLSAKVAAGLHVGLLVGDKLADLQVDYPSAPEMLGNFVARFVADDALDELMLVGWLSTASNSTVAVCIERALALLATTASRHRLHDIWGVGGGQMPTRTLTHQIQLILKVSCPHTICQNLLQTGVSVSR
jgi:hypothetical protein